MENAASEGASHRKVGCLLSIGIVLMPIVFVWFLVRTGHSLTSRVLGFSWATLFFFLMSGAWVTPPDPNTPEGRAALKLQADEERARQEQEREAAAREEAEAQAQAEKDELEDRERRQSGFHCLSNWDGSFRPLVMAIEPTLRDPSSFEHAETRITPLDEDGNHAVIMKFRATNGFGGTNLETAMATVRSSDCELLFWQLIRV